MDEWGLWARDFAKSPGAAAFAAVIAASMAFVGISRQVAVSRSALDHQRDAANTTVWWETFEWASTRALPAGETDVPLPDSVTISTLQSLSLTATNDVQRAACAGVIDALTARVDIGTESHEQDVAHETPSSAALNALTSYVAASGGTRAASAKAEAVVYEHKVLSALTTFGPDFRVFREPPGTDSRADAVVEVRGEKVAVDVSFARTPQVVRARARSAAMHRRELNLGPLVLVSRFPPPFTPEEEAEMRVVVAQWDSVEDMTHLRDALLRASNL